MLVELQKIKNRDPHVAVVNISKLQEYVGKIDPYIQNPKIVCLSLKHENSTQIVKH